MLKSSCSVISFFFIAKTYEESEKNKVKLSCMLRCSCNITTLFFITEENGQSTKLRTYTTLFLSNFLHVNLSMFTDTKNL